MLPTHEQLDDLASRVEQAYGLRRPQWWGGCSTSRVWHTGAIRLWEAHAADPARVPLDAELFVASQPISTPLSDPWIELAHPDSARRYRSVVLGIIQQLRAELEKEVLVAERSIRRGKEIGAVVDQKKPRRSALSLYILARRAGRDDLASRFAAAAAAQHQSCPLYRTASLALIPAELYPDLTVVGDTEVTRPVRVAPTEFALLGIHKECAN